VTQRCFAVCGTVFVLAFSLAPRGARASTIYFADYNFESTPEGSRERFSLQRVNADGTGRGEVVHDIGPQPAYASMAVHDGVVYWRDYFNVIRAATTGGNLLGPTAPPNAQVGAALLDQAIDAAGVHTYFPGPGPSGGIGRILRGDFEFENATTLLETRFFLPNLSIALDEGAGKIYWAGAWSGGATGLVQRADLADGSNVETLLEGFAEDDYTLDLALDPAAGKLYIGNSSLRKIQRANLDGSGLEDVVADTYVFAMAVDPTPEPAATGVIMAAAAWRLLRRARANR
jgi:hypothetical protein